MASRSLGELEAGRLCCDYLEVEIRDCLEEEGWPGDRCAGTQAGRMV